MGKNADSINHCSELLQGVGGTGQDIETLWISGQQCEPCNTPIQDSEILK